MTFTFEEVDFTEKVVLKEPSASLTLLCAHESGVRFTVQYTVIKAGEAEYSWAEVNYCSACCGSLPGMASNGKQIYCSTCYESVNILAPLPLRIEWGSWTDSNYTCRARGMSHVWEQWLFEASKDPLQAVVDCNSLDQELPELLTAQLLTRPKFAQGRAVQAGLPDLGVAP